MPLTDAQCRAVKPAEKAQKLSDARGLSLQISPGGSKLWRMNYRFEGKQRTAAFGAYPDVSLATARMKAAELKDKLAAGVDPALKDGATAAPDKTFKDAARAWFNAREAQWVSGYAGSGKSRMVKEAIRRYEIAAVATGGLRRAPLGDARHRLPGNGWPCSGRGSPNPSSSGC
ncbi:Arm DNA-binding domain-containing protein [Phaeovulum sp.]|uniref:Arm DNA-binding domain-containing protein n=1 Tax=Phaeovulum sp. TaxID=2934796 RepID=UPI0039E6BBED